jgi:membrane complex biogenesis BtpA family protein
VDFSEKPVVAVVHLLPLPGAPLYDGDMNRVYESALADARTFERHGADAVLVENARDAPFYPDELPPETVAALAGVAREVVRAVRVPVGVAALRNDAEAALSVATAVGASFVRVNVHVGAVLAEQGILQGKSHKTLRLRAALKSAVHIWADARVKHSVPFAYEDLGQEVRDVSLRADAVIVSGANTGVEADVAELRLAKRESSKPVVIGSGVTAANLHKFFRDADAFIVGSCFKEGGKAANAVDERRVAAFMDAVASMRREHRCAG